jgi:hypothetical protein
MVQLKIRQPALKVAKIVGFIKKVTGQCSPSGCEKWKQFIAAIISQPDSKLPVRFSILSRAYEPARLWVAGVS